LQKKKSLTGELWIITGEIGAGKTTLCVNLVESFRQLGWQISGVQSPAIFEDGIKTGIAVVNLATEEKRKLATHEFKPEGSEKDPLHWRFDPEVLHWGNQVLENAVPTELLVVDEIGILELVRGEGWKQALTAINSKHYYLAILIMRPKLMEKALRLWPWGKIIQIENVDQVQEISESLLKEFIH
jgi:nucleoside-triphosphatase THEP1